MRRLLKLPRCADFTPSPDAGEWSLCPPQPLTAVSGSLRYSTQIQTVYSNSGIYFRFLCEDRRLSCTCLENMGSLYLEDVAEVFLWPREDLPVYFEYELSPLNRELPLLVCNTGDYYGWSPFEYAGPRRTQHFSQILDGPQHPLASCSGWQCSAFIPFALLEGLCRPPQPGTRWRADFFRIDYDDDTPTHWAWDPDTGKEFHQFHCFGTLEFA